MLTFLPVIRAVTFGARYSVTLERSLVLIELRLAVVQLEATFSFKILNNNFSSIGLL